MKRICEMLRIQSRKIVVNNRNFLLTDPICCLLGIEPHAELKPEYGAHLDNRNRMGGY